MSTHVVIIGGGFGGLAAAKSLKRQDVRVTLVDRSNHHLFQPLLYQVATAGLAPGDIAEPIRSILRRQGNATVRLGSVDAIDVQARSITVDGDPLPYDLLVVAAGMKSSYFGNDQWEKDAPGLKSIPDALEIRRRLLTAYETAEWTEDKAEQQTWMTFVVIGGGPTGVELAGAIKEIATKTLTTDFRNIDTANSRVVLVEAGDQVLAAYGPPLSDKAKTQLESIGVEVMLGKMVTGIDARGIDLGDERLDAGSVFWAAGLKASSLGGMLGVETDRAGRVLVEPDLSIPGHPEVLVIGDLAHFAHDRDQPLPGIAPVALQQGKHIGKLVAAHLSGTQRPTFHYRDLGTMATIGRSKAVAHVGSLKVSGLLAWLMWVFIHLMTLVGHRNRVLVFVKWVWAYFTWQQSARLVWSGASPPAAAPEPATEPADSSES